MKKFLKKLWIEDWIMIIALIIFFFAFGSKVALGEAHQEWDTIDTHVEEIWLGEVTDDKIILHWHNQETFALSDDTLTFQTKHGDVTIHHDRRTNRESCGEDFVAFCLKPREEQADLVMIIDLPQGWIAIGGFEFKLYEKEIGQIEIVPYTGG